MNTYFISTTRNWYWCGTITVFADSQSQSQPQNPWKMIQGPKGNLSWCLLLFSSVRKSNEEGKYIKQRNEGRCRPWAEEMLNQTADVGSASADSADHNCLHCLFFFFRGKKTETDFCTLYSYCYLIIKMTLFVWLCYRTIFGNCRCESENTAIFSLFISIQQHTVSQRATDCSLTPTSSPFSKSI